MCVERDLANMAIIFNRIPTTHRPKLSRVHMDEVPAGPIRDSLFMLATMVFDLTRKMRYIFEATKGYAALADASVARRLRADQDRLRDAEARQDYEALARELEQIITEGYEDVERWHEQVVDLVLRRDVSLK